MFVDRRKFRNLAAANTAAAAIHRFATGQSKNQPPPKSSSSFAFQQVDVFSPQPLLPILSP